MGDIELILERASAISNICYINGEDGLSYNVAVEPTLPDSFTSYLFINNLNGAAIEWVNGRLITAGLPNGNLIAHMFADKKIEIVAGTIRKKAPGGGVDGDKWVFINDSGHTTIGVSDDPDNPPELTAVGNVVTVPFNKEYSKVIAFLSGPDETLARILGASVGASVGTTGASITMGVNYDVSYHVYYDGADFQMDRKSQFGVTGEVATYDGSGNMSISHDAVALDDQWCTPNSNGGSVTPFIPAIKSVGSSLTLLNMITVKDIGGGVYANAFYTDAVDTRISFDWKARYKGQAILDGSNGNDIIEQQYINGNIWFIGVFLV